MRSVGRLGLVALAAALGHLLLLWLWNPLEPGLVPIEVVPRPPEAQSPSGHPDETTVLIAGDTALTDAAAQVIERHGFEYPLSATLDLTRGADLTLVNLEAPVSRTASPFALYKRYVYRMEPAALEALVWAGIDGVTLANNHLLDHGPMGLRSTLDHARSARLAVVGAGLSGAEARRGAVFRLGRCRVGVLGYLEDSFMDSLYTRSFAAGSHAGCARLEAAHLRQDINRLRRGADLVVVIPHWGRNYEGVTALQRFYGRLMIDFGADAVVGHHPHIVHPVAMHRGRPIVYSVGNYAFGTPGREWLRHGLLARLVLRACRLTRIEFIPLIVQNREIEFKPERLFGDEAAQMLENLAKQSIPLGARIELRSSEAVLHVQPGSAL